MTVHTPLRPSWTCAGCSLPWPCATRREELVAEYAGNLLPLAIYLASCLVDATYDIPDAPAGSLYRRFLGWLRQRPPGRL